jgi:hypothetical protein
MLARVYSFISRFVWLALTNQPERYWPITAAPPERIAAAAGSEGSPTEQNRHC